jgi:hypothetical protein
LKFFRYFLGGCLILVGVVLLAGGARLAGGDLGTPSVLLGLLVSVLGLELVVGSYAMVRRLPLEMGYRSVIYLILLWGCMPLVVALVQITRFGFPRVNPESGFMMFQLVMGSLAGINLAVFLRWAGLAKPETVRV